MNEVEEKRMLEAFELSGGGCREYPVDASDPMVRHELTVWKAAWTAALAYQDNLIRAAYADALTVCSEIMPPIGPRTLSEVVAHGSGIGKCIGLIGLRTPDDARRMMEKIKK